MMLSLIMMNMDIMAATPISGGDSAVLEVSSYEVEEGSLNAGEQITLNLAIHNCSSVTTAQNCILTFSATDDTLYAVYGEDNQVYLGTLAPNATKEVSISLLVSESYNSEMAVLKLTFNYASSGNTLENAIVLNIPTYATGQLTSESVIVAGSATVGVNALVSVRCKNSGNTDITEAKLVFDGNVEDGCKEIILPTISAGKTCSQDFYVRFAESGIQTLGVAYEYTDSQGNSYTVDCGEYVVNVTNSTETMGSTNIVVQQSSSSTYVMQIVLLAAALVAAAAAVVIYFKRHN